MWKLSYNQQLRINIAKYMSMKIENLKIFLL